MLRSHWKRNLAFYSVAVACCVLSAGVSAGESKDRAPAKKASIEYSRPFADVPEPSTYGLLGSGLAAFGLLAFRGPRKNKSS